jgi:ethanolamine utilization protein EutA
VTDQLHYDGHVAAHAVADPHDDPDVDSPFYWRDNVVIVSIGIDIGSSTSHLSFSRLKLRREFQGLSSRFVVVERAVLWESPITLTPYTGADGDRIDAEAIGALVSGAYVAAGLTRDDVDTGVVILTGQALKRENSRAIADAVSARAGDFVCVAAGDHFEAVLSAFGSGAVELSRETGRSVLCVDIGGGTTKFSLSRAGEVVATGILTVGARLVSWDVDSRVVRARAPELDAFRPPALGVDVGDVLSSDAEQSLAQAAAQAILAVVAGRSAELPRASVIADSDFGEMADADLITFSGGVSEYVFDRQAGGFGDLGPAIGDAVRAGLPSATPAELVVTSGGIRATVAGASQYSVQVSGNTVSASEAVALPVRNVPVLHPHVDHSADAAELTDAVVRELYRHELDPDGGVAFSLRVGDVPAYRRLRSLAEGLAVGLDAFGLPDATPVVVLLDKDVARSVGRILHTELGVTRPVVSLDNLALDELDFVDVGAAIPPAGVYPVVVKSLLFTARSGSARPSASHLEKEST